MTWRDIQPLQSSGRSISLTFASSLSLASSRWQTEVGLLIGLTKHQQDEKNRHKGHNRYR